MKNLRQTFGLIVVLGIAFVCIVVFDLIRANLVNNIPDKTNSTNTTNWNVLTNDELGIRLKVPPAVNTYVDKANPGCIQSLILGVPHRSTIYLMPEFSSCTFDIYHSSKTLTYSESSLSKKIQIIPVNNEYEINGVVRGVIASDYLFDFTFQSEEDAKTCFDLLQVSIPAIRSQNKFATIPVSIKQDGVCAFAPALLTVRYSPTFKKVVIIDSTFGFNLEGTYFLNYNDGYFDSDIYNSIEIFK